MDTNEDIAFQENTLKGYYFPSSDDEEVTPYERGIKRSVSVEEFFREPIKKKCKTKRSSTVGRAKQDTISYISTNTEDGTTATHLIKIEVYEMKKLENVDQADHWKHADIRVKYYTKPNNDLLHRKTRQLIYDITKGISNSPDCQKYSIKKKTS